MPDDRPERAVVGIALSAGRQLRGGRAVDRCITDVPFLLGGRLFVAGGGVGSMYEFPLPTIAPRDQ
ncbi:MAG: hypothetical protein U0269_12055 [Polyangiales bacterium]